MSIDQTYMIEALALAIPPLPTPVLDALLLKMAMLLGVAFMHKPANLMPK